MEMGPPGDQHGKQDTMKLSAEQTYEITLSNPTIDGVTNDEALNRIAALIDVSHERNNEDGLSLALKLISDLFQKQISTKESALLQYFTANAWAAIRSARDPDREKVWNWESEEFEQEVIHLRKAMRDPGFIELEPGRQVQILTNLGNKLNEAGRFVEAIIYWDRALEIAPDFGMALANKAYGLKTYGEHLYDKGHELIFLGAALSSVDQALKSPSLDPFYEKSVNANRENILAKRERLPEIKINEDESLLGTSSEERSYREWCLQNHLFLNPINDLGAFTVASHDVFSLPSIVVPVGEGPYYFGFFNQMKQEFVSARYLYFEAINAKDVHFSDKGVLLYNTLDYPSYSLATEKIKIVFRSAYSIFDKVAYFLNRYLALGIRERDVSFKSIWYSKDKKRIIPQLADQQNWPLRGIFWLSRDLAQADSELTRFIEPESQQISKARQHAEHKYFKVHGDLWSGKTDDTSVARDDWAFSISQADLIEKTLRLLELSRAALIYLSLAVHREEQRRTLNRNALVGEGNLDVWDDEWKRND